MTPDEQRLAAQAALYDEVLDTQITTHVVDFLVRTQMLLRIADDQVDTVRPVLHSDAGRAAARSEYDQLSDDERDKVHRTVAQHWSLNVNLAVRKMWHAADVLGFRGDTLDPKHVAMTAATYFSTPADDLVDELEKAANP